MALREEFTLGQSAFNDFLFSSVGEEGDGLGLTVLSALARLGLDPWDEAARLSRLGRDAGAAKLAEILAALPEGRGRAAEIRASALRLVDRLPRESARPRSAAPAARPESAGLQGLAAARPWLPWVGLVAAALLALAAVRGGEAPASGSLDGDGRGAIVTAAGDAAPAYAARKA